MSAYPTQSLITKLFSLSVNQKPKNVKISMTVFLPILNTRNLPYTFSILKENIPSILHSQCFNQKNLPFHKEVKETEIGHLFEHILLEYLCKLKVELIGNKKAVFRGETRWNWKKFEKGTFDIVINAGIKDMIIIPQALEKSVYLISKILQSSQLEVPNLSLHAHPSLQGETLQNNLTI